MMGENTSVKDQTTVQFSLFKLTVSLNCAFWKLPDLYGPKFYPKLLLAQLASPNEKQNKWIFPFCQAIYSFRGNQQNHPLHSEIEKIGILLFRSKGTDL